MLWPMACRAQRDWKRTTSRDRPLHGFIFLCLIHYRCRPVHVYHNRSLTKATKTLTQKLIQVSGSAIFPRAFVADVQLIPTRASGASMSKKRENHPHPFRAELILGEYAQLSNNDAGKVGDKLYAFSSTTRGRERIVTWC